VQNLGSNFPARPSESPSGTGKAAEQAGEAAAQTGTAPVANPANQGSGSSKVAETVVDGISHTAHITNGINSSKIVQNEAATAEAHKVNRQPGKVDVDKFAADLKTKGHGVTPADAKALNDAHVARMNASPHGMGHWQPPHDEAASAFKVKAGPDGIDAARVHGGKVDPNSPLDEKGRPSRFDEKGGFLTDKKGLDGLTRKEIQQKLALDKAPQFLQDAKLPAGSEVDLTNIGKQENFKGPDGKPIPVQQGGGVQFHDTQRQASFEQERVKGVDLAKRDIDIHSQRFANGLNKFGKAFKPVGVITDSANLLQAFQKDGNTIGKETIKEGASIAGGWGGGIAGAKGGAVLGAGIGALGGPIGVAAGGVIGGVVGGIAGALGGSWLGGWLAS